MHESDISVGVGPVCAPTSLVALLAGNRLEGRRRLQKEVGLVRLPAPPDLAERPLRVHVHHGNSVLPALRAGLEDVLLNLGVLGALHGVDASPWTHIERIHCLSPYSRLFVPTHLACGASRRMYHKRPLLSILAHIFCLTR